MGKTNTLRALIGKGLEGFEIVKMAEVYQIDGGGQKINSLGFFRDPDVASAFIGTQNEPDCHRVKRALVMTDGEIGFILTEEKPVKLFDDEAVADEIRKVALTKLSPEERRLLRLR